MAVSTGSDVLDRALDGGLPERRTVLLTGGPGTGKSTLAMGFLQDGLDAGERCLYVSTEQTPEELRASFEPFPFDLDHRKLTVTSVHATPGYTIESDERELTLQTLEGETMLGEGFSAPFRSTYVSQFLERYDDCDRVVFDSVSGLAPVAGDSDVFRRSVLDLIRLFSDRFEATALLVSEEGATGSAAADALRYSTHGVIGLSRERSTDFGEPRRYLRVEKMRGVDHDDRRFELSFDERGVVVGPRHRSIPDRGSGEERVSTGIAGLDELAGGGLVRGSAALLEHDGRATVDAITARAAVAALERDEAVVLFPSPHLTPEHLDRFLPDGSPSIPDLLAADRVFVIDFLGVWDADHRNVHSVRALADNPLLSVGPLRYVLFWRMMRIYRDIDRRRGDRSAFVLVHTETTLGSFAPDDVRRMYYWAKDSILGPADLLLFVQNPKVLDGHLAEFYVHDARQMFRTWVADDGLQYVRSEKAPAGPLKETRLVEYLSDPPHVRMH